MPTNYKEIADLRKKALNKCAYLVKDMGKDAKLVRSTKIPRYNEQIYAINDLINAAKDLEQDKKAATEGLDVKI